MKPPIPIRRDELAKLTDEAENAGVACQLLFRAQYGRAPFADEQKPISIGIASAQLADQIGRQALRPIAAAHAVAFLGRELSRVRIELSALREAVSEGVNGKKKIESNSN